jgi:hypothetical protein
MHGFEPRTQCELAAGESKGASMKRWLCSLLIGWCSPGPVEFPAGHPRPRVHRLRRDVGDVDGDGDNDIVTRLGGSCGRRRRRGGVVRELDRGDRFAQHVIGQSLEYVKDIVVADFDRDHCPDVAMRMDHDTQLWLQNPDRSWRKSGSSTRRTKAWKLVISIWTETPTWS